MARSELLSTEYVTFLSDLVEYRGNKSPSDEDVTLIGEKVLLLKKRLTSSELTATEREKITVILLGLLYHPFSSLPLKSSTSVYKESATPGLEIPKAKCASDQEDNINLTTVCNITEIIVRLQADFFTLVDSVRYLMESQERMFLEMDLSYKRILYSLSVISYLGYGLELTLPGNDHFFPAVLSSEYILIRQLPFLHLLLSKRDENIYEKGLLLASNLLNRLIPGTLDGNVAELLVEAPIEDSLVKIVKYSCIKVHRSMAMDLFKQLVNCFQLSVRCHLLLKVLNNPNSEQGVQRLVLLLYKDFFVLEKDWTPLIGSNNLPLQMIYRSFELSLPSGMDSDLAENYDSICSLLNFIRFLLLRDKPDQNVTKIWTTIDKLKEDCVDLIWQTIKLTKIRYKTRIQELQDESRSTRSQGPKQFKEGQMRLEILNDSDQDALSVPEITEDQESESLSIGLTNLELAESLIGRINDIISESKRSQRT